MSFNKSLSVSLFFVLSGVILVGNSFSQIRERVVDNSPKQQIAALYQNIENRDLAETHQRPKPTLTNDIVLVQSSRPLIKKTSSSKPINAPANNYSVNTYTSKNSYSAVFSQRMLSSIQSKMGIPYLYGSSGPNRYDCSGLVWSVFQDAGFYFERTSARTLWQSSEPVAGVDRFKFGTLVFFKGLGHMGIVADENGFYHASSSQGVTYSRFDGYWGKHLVGFRRLKTVAAPAVQ